MHTFFRWEAVSCGAAAGEASDAGTVGVDGAALAARSAKPPATDAAKISPDTTAPPGALLAFSAAASATRAAILFFLFLLVTCSAPG